MSWRRRLRYRVPMKWTCLGHAMWLVEAAKIRILFDPLLGATYHHGAFAPVPRRDIDITALKPDVIVVTHRHPDHFDIDSLDRLARQYPGAIILTADVFVGKVCQRLGFTHVSLLEDWQRLELEGLSLLTTPSFCAIEEWGMIVATDDGVVWNQVDTEVSGRTAEVLSRAAAMLERPALASQLDLVIARWQPLLQVEAVLGHATNFPFRRYVREVEQIAACNARAIIPGAAGSQLANTCWLNAFAYPVSPARLARDLARRCPEATVFTARPGAQWQVAGGIVTPIPDCAFVQIVDDTDHRTFRPLSIPPMDDPDPEGRGTEALRAVIAPWVQNVMAPRVGAHLFPGGTVNLCLEVVYPNGETDTWGIDIGGDRLVLSAGAVDDPDLRNQIAASELVAVIEGKAHWGRALLTGRLRSAGTIYTVDETGLEPMKLPPFFLYLAISYAKATETWVWGAVSRCLSRRAITPQ